MILVNAKSGVIPLGRTGENLAVRVRFPVTDWIEAYGVGTFQLLVLRNGDVVPYPANVRYEGGFVLWDVTASDTKFSGNGRCELCYFVGEVLAKSEIWMTSVLRSLSDGESEPPEPYESWVDEVIRAGTEAHMDAEEAKDVLEDCYTVRGEITAALVPYNERLTALEDYCSTIPGLISDATTPLAEGITALAAALSALMERVSALETAATALHNKDVELENRIRFLENHAILNSYTD